MLIYWRCRLLCIKRRWRLLWRCGSCTLGSCSLSWQSERSGLKTRDKRLQGDSYTFPTLSRTWILSMRLEAATWEIQRRTGFGGCGCAQWRGWDKPFGSRITRRRRILKGSNSSTFSNTSSSQVSGSLSVLFGTFLLYLRNLWGVSWQFENGAVPPF
jgi:hypothetical protein